MVSKNAAELLYELFMSWWESGSHPADSRRSILGDRIAETQLATRYLSELESFIEGSDAVPENHPILRVIPKYWAWIFADASWNSTPNSSYISDTEIHLLYDFRYNPVHQVGNPVASSLQAVTEGLPELIEEIDSDASLNDELKRYLKTVLHHAYKILSVDSRASVFEQERALSELAMALGVASAQTKDEGKAQKWKAKANTAASHFVSGFMGAAGGNAWTLALASGEVVQQIMGS